MKRKYFAQSIFVSLAMCFSIVMNQFLDKKLELDIGFIAIVSVVAIFMSSLLYYLSVTVHLAVKEGPINKPIKWYLSPALLFGVPMILICIYVIAN